MALFLSLSRMDACLGTSRCSSPMDPFQIKLMISKQARPGPGPGQVRARSGGWQGRRVWVGEKKNERKKHRTGRAKITSQINVSLVETM